MPGPKHCSSPELDEVVGFERPATVQASREPIGSEGVVELPVAEDQRLSKNAESRKFGVECDGTIGCIKKLVKLWNLELNY